LAVGEMGKRAMSRSFFAKLVLTVLAGGLLLGSFPGAEARECKWSGTPPLCEPTCPTGWKYMSKRPGGCVTGFQMLCCEPQGSTTHVDGVAPCHKQCSPLLGAVQPKAEAQRVYGNCRALCDHKGTVTCPDGSVKPWTDPKC
jgi:hypothetical protein